MLFVVVALVAAPASAPMCSWFARPNFARRLRRGRAIERTRGTSCSRSSRRQRRPSCGRRFDKRPKVISCDMSCWSATFRHAASDTDRRPNRLRQSPGECPLGLRADHRHGPALCRRRRRPDSGFGRRPNSGSFAGRAVGGGSQDTAVRAGGRRRDVASARQHRGRRWRIWRTDRCARRSGRPQRDPADGAGELRGGAAVREPDQSGQPAAGSIHGPRVPTNRRRFAGVDLPRTRFADRAGFDSHDSRRPADSRHRRRAAVALRHEHPSPY